MIFVFTLAPRARAREFKTHATGVVSRASMRASPHIPPRVDARAYEREAMLARDAPRDASARALANARRKLSSNIRDVRKRALRALILANVAGACAPAATARDPEVLRAVLELYNRVDDAYDERGAAARAEALDASAATSCAEWSPATFLSWLCAKEPMARVWLREIGAVEYMEAVVRESGRDQKALARLRAAVEIPSSSAGELGEEDQDDFGRYDAVQDARVRRARESTHGDASTSTSTSTKVGSAARVSFAVDARNVASAEGDAGFSLPYVNVNETDAQYLYVLTTHLDTCTHHALALGGLRELGRALSDLPVEAVVQHASRALERVCELLSASEPRLCTLETRREALSVVRQCAQALHRELIDVSRECLLTVDGTPVRATGKVARPQSPNSPIAENFPPSERGHGYGASRGAPTRVLPIAHAFMLHVIPAVCDPALRASAIRAVRLLLPLVQIDPTNKDVQPHGDALMRLGQYLDLWESSLATIEFESGAASEYLTCVQVSAEVAAVASGAPIRGAGAAHKRLSSRWYDVCVDEVIAAANPLARQYCAQALVHICPTLSLDISLVRDADQCLRIAMSAAVSGLDAKSFARIVSKATPALSIMGATDNVTPFCSSMTAKLVALASTSESADDLDEVVSAMLALLSHGIDDVRTSAYATLATASSPHTAARAILEHSTIIGELIVGGLNHSSTVRNAALCLESLCNSTLNRRAVATQVSLYSAWIEALIDDADAGHAAREAQKMIQEANVGGRLSKLAPLLRGLFHESEKVRVRSATDLAYGIAHGLSSAAQVLLASHDDPFDSVLLTDDEYVRQEDADSRVVAFKESLRLRTFDDVRACLRRFIFDDAKHRDQLLAELEIMMRDERLATVLADPSLLESLIKLTLDQGSHVNVVAGALRILAAAIGASTLVRDILSREDGRGGRVTQLLGLVFHPQRRIREAMASLLAYFLFSPVCETVTARVGAVKTPDLSLPKLFLETYRFPQFVPELESPPAVGDTDPLMTDVVDRNRVLYMFKRRQTLMYTYDAVDDDESALLAFALDEEAETESGELRVMRDAARISCAPVVIGNLVSALGEAQSYEEAMRIVDALMTNVQSTRLNAMAFLASLGRWDETSERFIRRPPRSTTDISLWVGMAEVLTSCLESFMRVEDSILPPLAMKKMIEVVHDVIVPLASAGAALSVSCDGDMLRDPPVLRHPIAAGKALGDDGGAFCAARADAVRAAMSLLANVYEAARRFRIYAVPDVDAEAVVAELLDIDCVGVVTNTLVGEPSCDYTARCVAIDAVNAALRLGGVPSEDIFNLVQSMLTRVYPSYSSSDHRGSVLMNKATRVLLLIMDSSRSDKWADGFYEIDDLVWLSDMLVDASSRARERAWQIVAASVGPSSPIADVIAAKFPDIFERATACALDKEEAAVTRAAAFRCVAALIAGSFAQEVSLEIPDDGFYSGEKSSVPFPSIPMLAAKDVWRDFARVLMDDVSGDDERVAVLHRGASSALLAAARVDALGIAEAFDFNPSHETDGTMWHGTFAVLRRTKFVGYGSTDAAAAASNVAALLGVMVVAGVTSFDVKLAASALYDCLRNASRTLRSGGGGAAARAASRCAEALATVLQAHSHGDEDVFPSHGVAAMCAEILANAVGPSASPECIKASVGACLLTSTVFRSKSTSERAIDGAFEHVGASILQSLLVLWHFRLLGNSTQQRSVPTMSIIISATRNVLAHDVSAKAAACEWGLVSSLVQTTVAAVRRSMSPDGSFKSVPTAMDVYVASSAMRANRRDALAAAMEFGLDADGKELPSTVALGSLTCLRHMMYSFPTSTSDDAWLEEIVNEIRENAVDSGIVDMFRTTWPYATLDQTVMYELLSLVVNFVAKCPNSKRAITAVGAGEDGEQPKSFAQRLMDHAFDSKHAPGSSSLCLTLKALSSLATVEGPARYWLIRSSFVDDVALTLAHALTKVRAYDSDANDVPRARWMTTVTACVRALCNVASFGDGQRAVLRANAGAHVFELCLEVVAAAADPNDDARRETFLLMHNLAFHPDAKSHYAANEVAIDCLVQGVRDEDLQCASASCGALFALTRNGQRVCALLRERGRDRALRAASKSHAAKTPNDPRSKHWSRCLRGILLVLSANEKVDAYDGALR